MRVSVLVLAPTGRLVPPFLIWIQIWEAVQLAKNGKVCRLYNIPSPCLVSSCLVHSIITEVNNSVLCTLPLLKNK